MRAILPSGNSYLTEWNLTSSKFDRGPSCSGQGQSEEKWQRASSFDERETTALPPRYFTWRNQRSLYARLPLHNSRRKQQLPSHRATQLDRRRLFKSDDKKASERSINYSRWKSLRNSPPIDTFQEQNSHAHKPRFETAALSSPSSDPSSTPTTSLPLSFPPLSNSLACALLNALAFGYAATEVAVKLMETVDSETTGKLAGGIDVAVGQVDVASNWTDAVTIGSSSLGSQLSDGVASIAETSDVSSMLFLSHPGLDASFDFTMRFWLASFCLLPLFLIKRNVWRRAQKGASGEEERMKGYETDNNNRNNSDYMNVVKPGVELGFWMFATYAGQAVGLMSTSADHAALILTLSVLLVPLLESFSGRKIPTSVWIATALASVGMVLLEGGSMPFGGSEFSDASSALPFSLASLPSLFFSRMENFLSLIPVGHLWCMLGAAGSAVHVFRSEAVANERDPCGIVAVQLLTTAVLSSLWLLWEVGQFHLLVHDHLLVESAENFGPMFSLQSSSLAAGFDVVLIPAALSSPLSPSSLTSLSVSLTLEQVRESFAHAPWLLIALAGPVGTALCEWFELEALRFISASSATLILTTVPLWASLLAFLLMGEILSDPSSLSGAALILFASLQVQLQSPPKEHEETSERDPLNNAIGAQSEMSGLP